MSDTNREDRALAAKAQRQAMHRSVYGLVFTIFVYVAVLLLYFLTWPRFVEDVLVPHRRLQNLEAQEEQNAIPPASFRPPPSNRQSVEAAADEERDALVAELPGVIRAPYAWTRKIRQPVWWLVLAAPILAGVAFQIVVKNDRIKTAAYYVAGAVLGLTVLVGAIVVIIEIFSSWPEPVPGG